MPTLLTRMSDLGNLADQRLAARVGAEVGRDALTVGRRGRLAHAGHGRGHPIAGSTVDDHVGPFGSEQPRRGKADAGG